MSRPQLTADEMLALIAERMRESAGPDAECAACVPTQLGPIKPLAGGVNWQVVEHVPCSDPCVAQMLETCSRLADEYDIRWQPGDALSATPGGAADVQRP